MNHAYTLQWMFCSVKGACASENDITTHTEERLYSILNEYEYCLRHTSFPFSFPFINFEEFVQSGHKCTISLSLISLKRENEFNLNGTN